jgi:hypothetical protein
MQDQHCKLRPTPCQQSFKQAVTHGVLCRQKMHLRWRHQHQTKGLQQHRQPLMFVADCCQKVVFNHLETKLGKYLRYLRAYLHTAGYPHAQLGPQCHRLPLHNRLKLHIQLRRHVEDWSVVPAEPK